MVLLIAVSRLRRLHPTLQRLSMWKQSLWHYATYVARTHYLRHNWGGPRLWHDHLPKQLRMRSDFRRPLQCHAVSPALNWHPRHVRHGPKLQHAHRLSTLRKQNHWRLCVEGIEVGLAAAMSCQTCQSLGPTTPYDSLRHTRARTLCRLKQCMASKAMAVMHSWSCSCSVSGASFGSMSWPQRRAKRRKGLRSASCAEARKSWNVSPALSINNCVSPLGSDTWTCATSVSGWLPGVSMATSARTKQLPM